MGGDRIGSGAGMDVDLKTYNRSNHNLSTTVKTTMAPGTLVPFLNFVGMPGDTFDIELDAMIFTKPTTGPLYDTYKFQVDIYSTAMRLYLPLLHNNPTMLGLNMSQVKLPQIKVTANVPTGNTEDIDNCQINPSSVLKYLGISGLSYEPYPSLTYAIREFNAMGFLALWDIYKNYYANKQEEIGAVIHNVGTASPETITSIKVYDTGGLVGELEQTGNLGIDTGSGEGYYLTIVYAGAEPIWDQVLIETDLGTFPVTEMFDTITQATNQIQASNPLSGGVWMRWRYATSEDIDTGEPQVYTFPLENIDKMRNQLLANIMSPTAYQINESSIAPYGLPLKWTGTRGTEEARYSIMTNLEGLPLKTYQSDQFQNWMSTEWITDINARSTIDVTGGLTMDALAMMKNVWILLNRVAMADGSYKSWIDTVYTTSGKWRAETPVYEGGMSREIIFDEVISNSEAGTGQERQPLGTIGGRGTLGSKSKGGRVVIKADEMIQVTGIASITPRIGYSQGNTWDVNLKTMDDFHKPQLDGIGFQDLLTDWMAWWNTGVTIDGSPQFKSAGKQPAWMNYRTNVDRNYGNFANQSEMFMTLNRRYEAGTDGEIIDLTTYIDPKKYNYVFAETDRSAQNFWVQIKTKIDARRVMSTSVIPNI